MWLIIGQNGFFASNLINRLSKTGIAYQSLSVPRGPLGVNVASFKRTLRALLPNVRAVVMCSWQGIPDFSYENNKVNFELHDVVFQVLADVETEVSLFCFGSCAEYVGLTGAVNETSTGVAIPPLGIVKRNIYINFEELKSDNLRKYWIIPFFATGAFQRRGSLFDHICRSLVDTGRCFISKSVCCDFVHIQDIFDVLFGANVLPSRRGGVVRINVGSGKLLSCMQLAEIVSRWAEQKGLGEVSVENSDGEPSGWNFYSSNEIRNTLISYPPRSIERMLDDCYAGIFGEIIK